MQNKEKKNSAVCYRKIKWETDILVLLFLLFLLKNI